MREARRRPWALVVLAAWLPWGWAQPFDCAPGCTKRGNCVPDTGECICQYGYLGKACEIDALSACRLTPGGPGLCGWNQAKNCECYRQCERYHCTNGACRLRETIPPEETGCFMREGVPPEEQNSKTPEAGEKGVKYFMGWREGAREAANASEAEAVMNQYAVATRPLSECPKQCSLRALCVRWVDQPKQTPYCACPRGYKGVACEEEEPTCYLNCSGRGKCTDKFCHCEPPYFSHGCTRKESAPPPGDTLPNPARFKIYMYELSTQLAYNVEIHPNEPREDQGQGEYSAYMKFLSQFLTSEVRTTNPAEANMFYVPALTFAYSKVDRDAVDHLNYVLDHVRQRYPYWNRTDGRDHFVWHPADRGGCHLPAGSLAEKLVHVLQFGYHHIGNPKDSMLQSVQRMGSVNYSCYHPQRDVIAATMDNSMPQWSKKTFKMSVDEIIASKSRLLFFFGGSELQAGKACCAEYSGWTRQTLDMLSAEWDDPELELYFKNRGPPPEGFDMGVSYGRNKFCFVSYGWGFSNRLTQSVMNNCIPVIVQEKVFQPYEDLLPYESFSIRLTNADLPRVREILRSITDEQYRAMLESLIRYRPAFNWFPELGGRAFDYTIAALRRRYLSLKTIYF